VKFDLAKVRSISEKTSKNKNENRRKYKKTFKTYKNRAVLKKNKKK
jgi:hypothetical protein